MLLGGPSPPHPPCALGPHPPYQPWPHTAGASQKEPGVGGRGRGRVGKRQWLGGRLLDGRDPPKSNCGQTHIKGSRRWEVGVKSPSCCVWDGLVGVSAHERTYSSPHPLSQDPCPLPSKPDPSLVLQAPRPHSTTFSESTQHNTGSDIAS